MISSKTMFSVAALACAWIGLAGCDGAWPIDAKAALEAAKGGTSTPSKPAPGGEKPGEKPPEKPTGNPATVPAAPPPCKVANGPDGAPCKTCFDAAGKIILDECTPGGGPSTGPTITCSSTTDPKTGQVCKTCSGPDGKVTTFDCTPVAQPGSIITCTSPIDEETGLACKVCTDETGKVTYTDCPAP